MRVIRDEKQEMPSNFTEELHKWALECEYRKHISIYSIKRVNFNKLQNLLMSFKTNF